MGEWRKTMCDLCPTGCGLEVLVDDNRIVKARGDKDNGRSQGYCCRKGLSIQYHQHAQRLTHPLKRVGDWFERISWDQALEEIAAKIRTIARGERPRLRRLRRRAGSVGRPVDGRTWFPPLLLVAGPGTRRRDVRGHPHAGQPRAGAGHGARLRRDGHAARHRLERRGKQHGAAGRPLAARLLARTPRRSW